MNAVTPAVDGIGRPMNVVVRGNRGRLTRKSFLQPGEAITLTPPVDVKRDHVVSIGAFICIASTDAPKDTEIAVALTGVHYLPKAAAPSRKVILLTGRFEGRCRKAGELCPAWVPLSCRLEASRDMPVGVERK